MRIDKLTTKFQQALADAQSLALANDGGFIEPQHLLAALLAQEDGGTASLLQRAGVAIAPLKKALEDSIRRLPKVEGTGGEITVSRDLNNLLNLTDKEATRRGDQFIASELFLLAAARPSMMRNRKAAAKRSRNTPSTSPSGRARASSIRSSAATRRSAVWCRSCSGAPRTTRC